MGTEAEEAEQVRLIVSDTGPLLHLWEANALELLHLSGDIYVPQRVRVEIASYPAWRDPVWLQVGNLVEPHTTEAKAWQQAGFLDPGEAEAIALAQQLQATWLLTDDAAAKLLAQRLGLEVHGSLGIVIWAATSGYLNRAEAESLLHRLEQSSLWVSAKVFTEALLALDRIY